IEMSVRARQALRVPSSGGKDLPMTITTISSLALPRAAAPAPAGVRGGPRALLRLEGAALLLGALALYVHLGGGLGLFAALFLVPDLSMLGYLLGPRAGAGFYNAGHSTLGPALLAAGALSLGAPAWALLAGLIWAAHIGFDRMFGYGLKYGRGFAATHLGELGDRKSTRLN